MKIRKLVRKNIPALVNIVFSYKRSLDPDFNESKKKEISLAFHNALHQKNTRILVYLNSEDTAAGYIIFHLIHYPMIAGKETYVSDLLIGENMRGKGIGKCLLLQAELFAKEKNCVRMMLNNPKESEGYKRDFYKKQGFTERTAFANFVKTLD